MLKETDLHPYQRRVVDHILTHRRCGVFLEMGLGKTASALTAVVELMRRGEVRHTLIVAPKRVALHTWEAETAKWEHLRHLTAVNLVAPWRKRAEAMKTPADLHIINVDNLPWLLHEEPMPYDLIILDEFSGYKSHTTKRFKSLKDYLRIHPRTRLVGLTGTPAPNSLEDLWSQVYLLDGGERLGKYITHFRRRYFYPLWGNGQVTYKWGLQPGAEQAIHDRIADICISMRSEDYLTLPPVRYVDIPAEITAAERQQYNAFRRDQVTTLDGEQITAANAAVLSGKLRQWTGGAVYTDEAGHWAETSPAKIERLRELLTEIHTPVLIVYEYRHELERLRKALPEAHTIDEPGVFGGWCRGEVPVLLGHPASMGHGLNLQSGGHVIIWYSLTWSLEYYQQLNARLARQGQTERVTIAHLVIPGTLDERIAEALRSKEGTQDALLDALKAEIGA